MRRHRFVSLALAGALAFAISVAVSAPAGASGFTYTIHNSGNAFCLQPINGTQDLGAEVVQDPCSSSTVQRWVFQRLSGTQYRIDNENSDRCLNALGGATNGTRVVQWSCSSISNQIWDTGVTLTGRPVVVTLKSRVSGTSSHCLDVPGSDVFRAGLPMQIFGCNGSSAQNWILLP